MRDGFVKITIHSASGAVWPVSLEQRVGGVGAELPLRVQGCLELDRDALLTLSLDHRAYGTYLGQALFRDAVRDAFMVALGRSDTLLRVALAVEAPELAALAWERLCAPIDGVWQPLALDQRVAFSHLLSSNAIRPFPHLARTDLRTLLVAASPAQLTDYQLQPFDAADAIMALRSAFGPMPTTILGPVASAAGPPTLDAICWQLTCERYAILHLMCHSLVNQRGETVLFLAKAGNPAAVEPLRDTLLIERLARLGTDSGLPRFIFLAACATARRDSGAAFRSLAQRLVAELGIPTVVAMTGPISVRTATDLAAAFYQRLSVHGALDRALGEATAGLASRPDITIPALFSRLELPILYQSPQVERRFDTRQLRAALLRGFNLEELELLCADLEQDLELAQRPLRVNLEMVGGVGLEAKILRLIEYLERRGALPYLVAAVQRVRPDVLEL